MTTENEPAKLLLPYLQRADELQKHEPLVAYYCRLYAMDRGMRIPQKERTKTTNALLVSLMNQLEKDKKSLQLGPDDHLHVEGFASSVFARADKQDRAGRSDLNTAKTFYAASIFFEILNQFADVQPDLEQKQKYAAWKAADIRKALKEGKQPLPGPPGGEKDLSVPSSTSSGEYDVNPSRNDFPTAPDPSRRDPSATLPPDSDLSPQPYDKVNLQHSANISPQPSNIPPSPSSNISPQYHYPTDGHPSDNFHQPPPTNTSYPQSYHHQPYHPEPPQQHFPQNYPSQDLPSSFPNFQSYPSFNESTIPTLPTVPSHYPSYHQGSDASYSNPPPVNTATYTPTRSGNVPEASPTTTQNYEYDSNYQPSPEKIAEAHKAARFAVGALAFDDVSIAVDHLKKSLELLTNPSATH
ncbi:hypothetical protein BUALT_Bualt18G0070500 [Buddleja alternifolia]|uniref:Uncharacterized protein n=1 Tax=Buddleja alternifolia TaxID=168488 RepID=A0AAV6W990_9LAMI|nr:hypothetical protein BUALT_Bualt18G0070500 [Buddleja alternifolia]